MNNTSSPARRTQEPIAAIVLAAGRSSRMGQPKPLLEVEGQTALARVLAACREAELRPVVILGFHAEEVQSRVDLEGAEVVLNPEPGRGQSSSVRLGARAAEESALCLFPVDHAFVRHATVRRLAAAFRARPARIEIALPTWGGRRGHPAWFGAGARAELAQLGESEPAHAVVRRESRRVLEVECDDPAVVRDADTPGDLRRLRGSSSS